MITSKEECKDRPYKFEERLNVALSVRSGDRAESYARRFIVSSEVHHQLRADKRTHWMYHTAHGRLLALPAGRVHGPELAVRRKRRKMSEQEGRRYESS
jgi:hypothetical protein